MNYRLATILERTNYQVNKTEIIDIDVLDPISQILLTLETDNVDSGLGSTGHPVRGVSKIELIDGSDVLWSLNGAEAAALNFYERLKEAYSLLLYMTGINSEVVIPINFGRRLFDPEYAFDPPKFKNPQLKITMAVGAGGCKSTSLYLTVLAHIFDEKAVAPKGFLSAKEVKDYTLADSAHEYTDLPTDRPYRFLFIRPQRYGTGPEDQIDTVKISEEVDKRIPLNHTMKQILRNMVAQWPIYREAIIMSGGISTDYMNYHCAPCHWPRFAGAGWRKAANIGPEAFFEGDGGRFTRLMDTYAGNVQAMIEGYAPHAMIPLLPPPSEDPEDWWDVTPISSLKLDVKAGSSVGTAQTAQVVVQQLREY